MKKFNVTVLAISCMMALGTAQAMSAEADQLDNVTISLIDSSSDTSSNSTVATHEISLPTVAQLDNPEVVTDTPDATESPDATETPEAPEAADAPEVEKPEVEAPEVETPEVEAPEVETPEVEAPEVETPEVEAPESP